MVRSRVPKAQAFGRQAEQYEVLPTFHSPRRRSKPFCLPHFKNVASLYRLLLLFRKKHRFANNFLRERSFFMRIIKESRTLRWCPRIDRCQWQKKGERKDCATTQ